MSELHWSFDQCLVIRYGPLIARISPFKFRISIFKTDSLKHSDLFFELRK